MNVQGRQSVIGSGAFLPRAKALCFGATGSVQLGQMQPVPSQQLGTAKPKKSVAWTWLKGGFRSMVNVVVMLSAVVGGGYMYDQIRGDGPLPVFQAQGPDSRDLPEDLKNLLTVNTTAHWVQDSSLTQEESFKALGSSLRIVRHVVPEIADWYEQMYQSGRLTFKPMAYAETMYGESLLAGYDQVRDTLTIGPKFWGGNELDKAGTLVHEFRHSRQNKPKILSDRLTQMLTLRLMSDSCRLEDEAYLYQQAFYHALGQEPSVDVQGFLKERNLLHTFK